MAPSCSSRADTEKVAAAAADSNDYCYPAGIYCDAGDCGDDDTGGSGRTGATQDADTCCRCYRCNRQPAQSTSCYCRVASTCRTGEAEGQRCPAVATGNEDDAEAASPMTARPMGRDLPPLLPPPPPTSGNYIRSQTRLMISHSSLPCFQSNDRRSRPQI